MRQSKRVIRETLLVLQRCLVVAIDISKRSLHVYACTREGVALGSRRFVNRGPGFQALLAWIMRLKRENYFASVLVGMEPTGNYGKPLQRYLFLHGVMCVQVNPAHVKKIKDLEDNSPEKNDKKDPVVIADLVRQGKFLTTQVQTGVIEKLRHCVRARERAVTLRTQLLNELESVVFEAFPEFFSVFPRVTTRTAQAVLAHYPTPREIREAGVEKLTELIRRASQGRSGRKLAEALVAAAEESVGIGDAEPEYRVEVKSLLRMIRIQTKSIRRWEKRMQQLLERVPYAPYILSIPGVAVVTAAALLSELGDLRRYRSKREILKYAGLNLYQLSSGKYRGQPRLSKRGSPILRKYLYLAALAAVNPRNSVYRDFYKSYAARSCKQKALVAVARKLLVLVFTLVRRRENYQPRPELAGV